MRLPHLLSEKMGLDLSAPARIIPMGRRSVTGRLSFRKKLVGFESQLEHDFLVRAEMDPTVTEVFEQPVTIPCVDESGRPTKYTPDFLVRHDDGREVLWEVKFTAELRAERHRLRARLRAGRSFAKEHGLGFRLATDRLIRARDFANLTLLRRYLYDPEEKAVEAALLGVIRRAGATTPRVAIDAAFQTEADRQAAIAPLWRLMANGIIRADLNMPLTMASSISARGA